MASDGVIDLRVGSASLLAVPAVHYQAPFALLVNQVCGEPGERPDAIAVELGPLSAAAASLWLHELGIGPAQRKRLPCMLGLVKTNRLLRPSMRERALDLQRETGRDLRALKPQLLREELGFSRLHALLLSPTDSIIEALRCAVELGIPVHGVDLDDMADGQYPQQVLPDPADASLDPGGYMRAMIPMAAASATDAEIDPRREYVMAARLKSLLARHRRVLFTGGLAHWARIAAHLCDPRLPQAALVDGPDKEQLAAIRRAVIHPSLAVHFMDVFPAMAGVFERRRRHPLLDEVKPVRTIDPLPVLQARLRRAYRTQVAATSSTPGHAMSGGWAARNAFEQMLAGQSLLSMRSVPNLAVINACARATLPVPLRQQLHQALTDYPWIDADDFPDCVRLRPTLAAEGAPGQVVLCEDGWGHGETQHVSFQPAPPTAPTASYESDPGQQQLAEDAMGRGYRFCWRPWESLTTALCCSAIAQAQGRRREACAERFAGQLLDGIDIKGTLRAHARGQDEIWVRADRLRKGGLSPTSPEGFPVVWILDEAASESSRWSMFFEPIEWLEAYARNGYEFRRRFARGNNRVINLFAYGRDPEWSLDAVAGRFLCSGLIVFSPVFAASKQNCRWVEATNGQHNPIVPMSCSMDCVVFDLARHQGLTPETMRWQDLLVASALPHCGAGFAVVAPSAFELDDHVLAAASRQGKAIRRVPLSAFADSQIQRITRLDSMPGWMDKRDGRAYYFAEAESLVGEPTERYLDLVPSFWQRYGLDG